MPYITKTNRAVADCSVAETTGQLNYQVTQCLIEYMKLHGKSYKVINDIVGALECAKQEFFRRVVGPYEDEAIKRNGDIY